MKSIDDVLAEATRQTTLVASLSSFVANIQAQLKAQGLDPAKVDAVFNTYKANDDVVEALMANTSGDPAAAQPAA